MSTDRNNHKKKSKREESIIGDTVQMDLFIYFLSMIDSCTDAVNKNETETEH